MHMVIRAIVYANSREEAKVRAERVFKDLTENEEPFDYYSIGFRDGSQANAFKATSKQGKELLERGMKLMAGDFGRSLEAIRQHINKPNNVLMLDGEETGSLWRYHCYQLGMYRGPAVWLYDDDGEGIRDSEHLENALNKWRCLYEDDGKPNPHANDEVWVVPADVHS